MLPVLVLDHDTVLAAVPPADAVEHVRRALTEHALGEWDMPPKLYLDAEPNGDFRAMPARGGGLAVLKWVTSFPGNREAGLPVVMGVVCISSAESGELLALADAAAVTVLRTGAVAAVSAQELAREDAKTVGLIGCGVNGAWAARCLAAVEYGPGVCNDMDPDRAGRLAGELGWEAGSREDALGCDVVVCVTPGHAPVLHAADVRPGTHYVMMGADGPGKAEAEQEVLTRCRLFCDEWAQASHGGELTGAVEAGLVTREQVTEIGDVLTGRAPGRGSADESTLFDSTGLAVQDLAIAHALMGEHRRRSFSSRTIRLA